MKRKAPLCINCISPSLLSLGSGCRADPGLAAQRVTAGSWQSKDPRRNSNQARSHFFILAIADQSWGAGNIHVDLGVGEFQGKFWIISLSCVKNPKIYVPE